MSNQIAKPNGSYSCVQRFLQFIAKNYLNPQSEIQESVDTQLMTDLIKPES